VPRLSSDAPVVVIDESPEETELPTVVEHFDPHKIGKLAHESLHALFEAGEVALDLRPQQNLHAVVRELGLQLIQATGRIVEEAIERNAHAGL
jgi:hypothetical protein